MIWTVALLMGDPDPLYLWELASYEYDLLISTSPRVLKYAHIDTIHADTAVRLAEIVFRDSGHGKYVNASDILQQSPEHIRTLEFIKAWDLSGFSISGTAEMLGINRKTVYRQFKKLGFNNLALGTYGSSCQL